MTLASNSNLFERPRSVTVPCHGQRVAIQCQDSLDLPR